MALSSEQTVLLVKRCLENDQAAWDEFVDNYKNLVYSKIYRLLCRFNCYFIADLIDDIFQDVFIKILNNIHNLREPEKIIPYINRIIFGTTIDCIRKEIKNKNINVDFEQLEMSIQDNNKPADDLILEKESITILGNSITSLAAKEKLLLELFYYKNNSYKEISRILNVSEGRVGSMMNEIKNKIRQYFTNRSG